MADKQDEATLKAGSNQFDTFDVEALPRNIWFKRNCVSCTRHDMPFEQRNWSACLGCTIDARLFQIEGFGNPRNSSRSPANMQKLLDNFLELLQIYKYAEMWRQVLGMAEHELVTIEYDGKPEPRNFSAIRLTQKGKKVLGRPNATLSNLEGEHGG